jgi:glycosyltransferase involved in cell wall biosynthesis
MKRIALDLRFWRSDTAGVGRYSRNLLKELVSLDTEFEFTAIINKDCESEFSLEAPNLKKLIVDIPIFSYAEQLEFLSLLNKEKFDLVHFTHFTHPVLYRRPFVVTVHDMIMHLHPTGAQQRSLLRKLAYRWDVRDCKRADRIIVPSQATKEDLVQMLGFSKEKIVVTPEASEEKFMPASSETIKALRQKYNLPERYILFVSRWERYKGLPVLIEAFSEISKDIPNLGLVIAGKPSKQNPEIAALVQEAQKQELNIITPGFISDDELPTFYSGASVYVHPSLYEGFGIMILEAFGCGAPVVTSNVSSLPEVVGDAGLLVDPKDTRDVALKIRQILADPQLAEDLRRKGFERVRQYSWRRMAEQTLESYNEVLKKPDMR